MKYLLLNVEVAERLADGLATADELQAAREAAEVSFPNDYRAVYALGIVEPDAFQAAKSVVQACLELDRSELWIWQLRKYEQCRIPYNRLAADVFDPLFSGPVAFDASWKTSTAVALAQQMYDSRDFSAMPILADALQDAGCNNDDILNHCRDPEQPHIRGCWVVDLLLGKS